MKASIINRFPLLLLALVALVSVTSCDKEDDDHDHDGHGHMHVYFNNKIGTSNLAYNTEYTGANGRDFTFSLNQYYVSNVKLIDHDGNEVALANTYLLVKTGATNELEFEELPAGHYHQIKFDIGIDSVTNHSDPSTYDATSPLAPQTPGMHWSWNSGYIFFKIEGLVDTSAAKTGTADADWNIHMGTDAFKTTVTLDIDKEVTAENHPGININLDANALFDNIDLGGTDISTHTMNNMDLAMRFKANIPAAFTAE